MTAGAKPAAGRLAAGRRPATGEPLAGRVVLVTRPPEQSEELSAMLRDRGATVLPAPAIRLLPASAKKLEAAAAELAEGGFRWALFTSRAGVEAVASALERIGRGFQDAGCLIGAVGEGTAGTLVSLGATPDLVPSTFTTAALGRAMPRGRGRVLLARADIAPRGLEQRLVDKGWSPVRVDAYRTQFAARLPSTTVRAIRSGAVDVVTFTSASTVDGFANLARQAMGEGVAPPSSVCIGPVTAVAARRAGFRVVAVARPHTIEGLVAAVERSLRPRRTKER